MALNYLRRFLVVRFVGLVCVLCFSRDVHAQAIDLEIDNAAIDLVIPTYIPVALSLVKPGDAPLLLRQTAFLGTAFFDAIAPYHATAVGIYSQLGRRPASESETHLQRNIAIMYASYRALTSLFPEHQEVWGAMMDSVGLDPSDDSQDLTTPVGIGNVAGAAVVQAREHDGMNQLGDEGGVLYNREPYSNYVGYEPVNTAFTLVDAGRWQPYVNTSGNGIFTVQTFVTPQLGITDTFLLREADEYTVKAPLASDPDNWDAYRAQADEVLEASANLTDRQKMMAEFFEHKFRSLAGAGLHVVEAQNMSFNDAVFHEVLLQLASFDGARVIWKEKRRFDAVRPFTAVRWLYGDQHVTAWGGPGRGTVSDITGNEWRSYLDVANHPEYPSASSCFCAAHAEVSRRFTGTDDLGFSITYPQGSSVVEPGVTPQQDLTLTFATWSDFAEQCRNSRFWGGVHFRAATTAGAKVCEKIGQKVWQGFRSHIQGNVGDPAD